MNTKLKLAVSGILLAGALSSGSAYADPLASAETVAGFTNFTITSGGNNGNGFTGASAGGTIISFNQLNGSPLPGTNAGPASVSSAETNSATIFNGPTIIGTDTGTDSSSVGTPLHAVAQTGTLPGTALNSNLATTSGAYSPIALPTTTNYAASMSNESGAPVKDFHSVTTPANLYSASFAGLNNTTAVSNGNTGSTLSTTVTFKGLSGVVSLKFDLSWYLADFLSNSAQYYALSKVDVVFTLKNVTTNTDETLRLFDNTGTIQALGATIDFAQQNNNAGTGATTFNIGSLTNWFVNTGSLVDKDTYQLTANFDTKAEVKLLQTIPEPESLALIGIGLLGFAATSRKSRPMVCA